MRKGDIVYIPFKFSDSEQKKLRVALVVSSDHINQNPRHIDLLAAKISSEIREYHSDYRIIVDPSLYPKTGLKVKSMIYLDSLQAIEKSFVKYIAGRLPDELMADVNAALINALGLPHEEKDGR